MPAIEALPCCDSTSLKAAFLSQHGSGLNGAAWLKLNTNLVSVTVTCTVSVTRLQRLAACFCRASIYTHAANLTILAPTYARTRVGKGYCEGLFRLVLQLESTSPDSKLTAGGVSLGKQASLTTESSSLFLIR